MRLPTSITTLTQLMGALCLCILLQSCVPAAFVAGATIGGAVVYDQRSMTTIKHDLQISEHLKGIIAKIPESEQEHIHVVINVFDGHVLLAGQVPDEALGMQLEEAAKGMKHARRIFNKITVAKVTTFRQRSQDTWITTKVRADLLAHAGFKSTQIMVMTENNVVYLMGRISRAQATMATSVAQKISGVHQVVKLFEYIE